MQTSKEVQLGLYFREDFFDSLSVVETEFLGSYWKKADLCPLINLWSLS